MHPLGNAKTAKGAIVLVAVVAISGAVRGETLPQTQQPPSRRFFRLSLGTVYLYEAWSPNGGGPGAVYSGLGWSLEAALGREVRPGLVVGGRWQLAAVIDPNESYDGRTVAAPGTARFLDLLGGFIDETPGPHRRFHFGGGAGVVAGSNLDVHVAGFPTGWGATLSAHVGYDRALSRRWSCGALAQLAVYRVWASESGVSSVSDGLLPTLAIAFTFR
jgi:hypothetical protein